VFVLAGRMRRTGATSGRQVRRADPVHREAKAVADRRCATGQGDQTAIAEGPRDQLYVQAAENHVPVAVLHRGPQRERSRFVFTSKQSCDFNFEPVSWSQYPMFIPHNPIQNKTCSAQLRDTRIVYTAFSEGPILALAKGLRPLRFPQISP